MIMGQEEMGKGVKGGGSARKCSEFSLGVGQGGEGTKPRLITLFSSGSREPWGPGLPLAPKMSSKSCTFQAIFRENPLF